MSHPSSAACLGLVVLLATASEARAEDAPKRNVAIRFLTDLNTLPLTIDTAPLGAWLKPVVAAVEARFPEVAGRKAIVVQVTLRRDGPAEIELAGNPALSEADVKAIEAVADARTAPRTKAATCSFRVVVLDKDAKPDQVPDLTPALMGPYERLLRRVRSAPARDGLRLLRQWATEESLPLLAASARGAEAKFAGVRNLGDALTKALDDPAAPLSVERLATANSDFWRAAMEMQPGDPLAPAVEASLLLATGRVEWAQQIATMAGLFDQKKSSPSALLGFGRALAEAYLAGVNARVSEGIALHDAAKYAQALAAYDSVLKDDPHVPWAIYERFHTGRTMALEAAGKGDRRPEPDLWPDARARILASNPLYGTMAEARGREGLFDLRRRLEIAELFKDGQAPPRDVVAYADIALDLGAFDMAAMLYWSILTGIEPKVYNDRPLLESFLYALERLGVKDLKDNFRGDHAAAFAAIEADRRTRAEAASTSPEPDAKDADPKENAAKR